MEKYVFIQKFQNMFNLITEYGAFIMWKLNMVAVLEV